MKLNDRGFAVSGIIYSILILFLVLIFAVLTVLGSRKLILDKLKNDVMTELNSGEVKEIPNLIDTLLTQYQGASTGLLRDSTNPDIYYYKGNSDEVSNNYLWYGGHNWRVVEFDVAKRTLTLISTQPLVSIQPANTAWETQEEYENSYINSWLDDYFYNSLDSSIQSNILDNTFNVGIYNDVDEITTTGKVGLLDQEQYDRAGGADSYLNINIFWWISNRYDSDYIGRSDFQGGIYRSSPKNSSGVRPVIVISDINIEGGNGTLILSYKSVDKATNTNDIQVGEYINVPYNGIDNACGSDNLCTFRVVSKDNDSIKVVLNGLLPSKSQYGSDVTMTTSHTIYTPLNTFANNISSNYRYTGNKVFYIGEYTYSAGIDYKNVKNETLSANVGLPTVGELFTSNDIDLGTSSIKTFVDINTIENPTVSTDYWVMNKTTESYAGRISSVSDVNIGVISYNYAVRPVIFLKSNLFFTGGSGTAQDPYTVS